MSEQNHGKIATILAVRCCRRTPPFEATLEQALTADAHRPKHGRRTAKVLFAQIQAQGYRGGYSAVTDFTRAWREHQLSRPPSRPA